MNANPILANHKTLSAYAAVWLLIGAVYVQILIWGEQVELKAALADALIFNLILAGLGLSYWHTAKYISIEIYSVTKIIISHLIGSLISVALWLSIGFFVTSLILETSDDYSAFFMRSIGWRILIGILFYFLIVAFYYLTTYYSNFHNKIVREKELRNLVTEAELKSLKFQINPHFIFNSLNSMSALTTIDPVKAQNMILKLAEFLRYTLVNNEKQKNKLSEEIKNINLYLDIEKIRFEDKFDMVEEVSDDSKDKLVPNMILQPLFENAIKHAVYESLEKVTLRFKTFIQNEFLNIILENNYDSNSENKHGSGIGLKNVNERLKLIYGLNNLLNVEKSDDKFRVTIFIPLNAS